MQKTSLIPTPLTPGDPSRRPIEVESPAPRSRFRFAIITFFIIRMMLRKTGASLWPRWRKGRFSPMQQARLLRSFMERMGGLWVKTGQIIALRRDLFSEEFCDELARLQDRARGFPGSLARRIVECELGQPIEKIFAEFDEKPLAAASIGQAHVARLHGSETKVVVKVQRPNIAESLADDFGYLRKLVWFLSYFQLAPQFRWQDMYSELSTAILEELDYQLEGASLKRMRKNLRGHKVYVPKVFLKYSTSRVLVMEMVTGVFMSEFIQVSSSNPERAQQWLKENQIKAKRVGKRLLFSHWRQLFEDNLYHCDLHPGNIILTRRNRITLIDFGSVGTTDKTLLTKYLHIYRSLAGQDYQKAADLFMLIAPSLPNKNISEVKEQVVRLYREFEPLTKVKTLPYHQKSIGRLAGTITQTMGKAEIPFPWDILRSVRSDLTLDAALMILLPGINYPKMIREYLQQARQRQQKRMRSSTQVRANTARMSEAVDMPSKLAENAYFEGEYLRRRALRYEGYLSKASRASRHVFLALSRILLVVSLAAIAILAHQRLGSLHILQSNWVYHLIERLPLFENYVWILIAVAAIHVSREFSKMADILDQPEPSRVGGNRH